MGPGAVEAREEVIELRQLHLQLTLSALGPLGKDVQDQPWTIHHPPPQQLLEVALLRARQLLVQDDQVHPGALLADLLRLALPDQVAGVQPIPPLQQMKGLSEVVGQSLAFSLLLVAWYHRPHRAWGIVLYTLSVLVVLMSLAGALAAR